MRLPFRPDPAWGQACQTRPVTPLIGQSPFDTLKGGYSLGLRLKRAGAAGVIGFGSAVVAGAVCTASVICAVAVAGVAGYAATRAYNQSSLTQRLGTGRL